MNFSSEFRSFRSSTPLSTLIKRLEDYGAKYPVAAVKLISLGTPTISVTIV